MLLYIKRLVWARSTFNKIVFLNLVGLARFAGSCGREEDEANKEAYSKKNSNTQRTTETANGWHGQYKTPYAGNVDVEKKT